MEGGPAKVRTVSKTGGLMCLCGGTGGAGGNTAEGEFLRVGEFGEGAAGGLDGCSFG